MRNEAGRKAGECHCRCHMATGLMVSMRLAACDGEASSQSLFCSACGRPKGAEGRGEEPRRNPDPPFGGPLGRGC